MALGFLAVHGGLLAILASLIDRTGFAAAAYLAILTAGNGIAGVIADADFPGSDFVALLALDDHARVVRDWVFDVSLGLYRPQEEGFEPWVSAVAIASGRLDRCLVRISAISETGMTATVEARGLSKWFGQKVAVSEVEVDFEPGITGLLGPNGAGKTTLLRLFTGLQAPSQGTVRILGVDPRSDQRIYSRVAMVPEDEAVYANLTARQFVDLNAGLARVKDRERCSRSRSGRGGPHRCQPPEARGLFEGNAPAGQGGGRAGRGSRCPVPG